MQLNARANRGRSSTGGREIHYVSLSFIAPDIESRRQRQAVNVGLVLDRSGSMAGKKLRIARAAVDTALSLLRAEDRFALVVFDDRIDLLAASRHADDGARHEALRRLAGVDARGSTNLGEGWLRGASEIEPHRDPGFLTRVIIATDGRANLGETDPERLLQSARMLQAKGITTSTIGIGADFQEHLLQGMADAGGGHAYYAEKPEQLMDQLAGEIGEALEITLRQPLIDVTIPAGVSVELLDAFPVTRARGRPRDRSRRPDRAADRRTHVRGHAARRRTRRFDRARLRVARRGRAHGDRADRAALELRDARGRGGRFAHAGGGGARGRDDRGQGPGGGAEPQSRGSVRGSRSEDADGGAEARQR